MRQQRCALVIGGLSYRLQRSRDPLEYLHHALLSRLFTHQLTHALQHNIQLDIDRDLAEMSGCAVASQDATDDSWNKAYLEQFLEAVANRWQA